MREILFRGKRVDNGEWVYGVPTKDTHGETAIVESLFECDEYKCQGANCLYVDENSVSEFTGLTDENGKKIFEGDIVVTNKFGSPEKKYVIVYDNKIATYIGEGKKGCCRYFTTFSGDADAFEIIGTIHDNPELLKGETK